MILYAVTFPLLSSTGAYLLVISGNCFAWVMGKKLGVFAMFLLKNLGERACEKTQNNKIIID